MGLAVYNSIILDLHFPSICYKKLLSPPVVPSVDNSCVGVVRQPTIDDLAEIMPVSKILNFKIKLLILGLFKRPPKFFLSQEVAKGLKDLLSYEGNIEEDMCMNFQVSLDEYGEVKTYKLKENGENIPVTNENRSYYVELYLNWILNASIYEQFRAFYLGFHSVCASNALIVSSFCR